MNEIYIRTGEIYDIDFFFRTVNFVINNLFFELYSFELRLSRRSYELLSLFLTPLLPIYAFNNIEIELLIKIQCSSVASANARAALLLLQKEQAKRCASKCYSRKPVHFAT